VGTLALGLLQLGTAGAADHTVDIKGLSFIPEELAIGAGDTVTWVNHDKDHHDLQGGPMDSPEMAQGQTFSFTFQEPGEIEYRCKIHTYMQGRITVGDGGSGQAPPSEPATTTTTVPPSTTTTTRPPSGPLGLPVPLGAG
jgi:plastocyanin